MRCSAFRAATSWRRLPGTPTTRIPPAELGVLWRGYDTAIDVVRIYYLPVTGPVALTCVATWHSADARSQGRAARGAVEIGDPHRCAADLDGAAIPDLGAHQGGAGGGQEPRCAPRQRHNGAEALDVLERAVRRSGGRPIARLPELPVHQSLRPAASSHLRRSPAPRLISRPAPAAVLVLWVSSHRLIALQTAEVVTRNAAAIFGLVMPSAVICCSSSHSIMRLNAGTLAAALRNLRGEDNYRLESIKTT